MTKSNLYISLNKYIWFIFWAKEVNNYDRSRKQTYDKLANEETETENKRQKFKIAVKRGEPRRRAGKITITDALSGQEARMRSLSSMRRQREKVKIQTESVPQVKQYRDVTMLAFPLLILFFPLFFEKGIHFKIPGFKQYFSIPSIYDRVVQSFKHAKIDNMYLVFFSIIIGVIVLFNYVSTLPFNYE